MDAVFRALSDPGRRRLLDRLNERNGLTLTELCADMGMTRQSVTKHLDVLEAAEPGHHAPAGAGEAALPERRPHQRHRRPLDPPLRPGAGRGPVRSQDGTGGHPHGPETTDDLRLHDLHQRDARAGLAGPDRPRLHRRATGATRCPAASRTARTGRRAPPTTWPTSEVGLVVSDPEQVILESDPYRRLAYTWHTFTPEWAAAHGVDEATAAAWRAEPRSKVAFDIEETGHGVVKLTVVHDGFEPRQRGPRGRHAADGRRHRQPQDTARDGVRPCRPPSRRGRTARSPRTAAARPVASRTNQGLAPLVRAASSGSRILSMLLRKESS